MIACVLLSAGESQRFGSPKALAKTSRKTAIEDLQDTLIASIADDIIVVLGAHAEAIEPHVFNHKKVRIVHNKDYKLGQTSSFQAGLRAVGDNARAVLLAPVDCPFIRASTVDALIRCFEKTAPSILVPVYNSRRGHPPVFSAALKKEVLALPPSSGSNTLFQNHALQTLDIDDPGIVQTFNTPEELEKIKKQRGHPRVSPF